MAPVSSGVPSDSDGSNSSFDSEDSGLAHGVLNRSVSQVIDRNRIADLLEQGRLANVVLHDVGLANGVPLNQESITQKMKGLLDLIIQQKDSENLLEAIYNYFMTAEPYFFKGVELKENGLKIFFKNQLIITRCENAKDQSGNTYIKDGKGAKFLATIGSIILKKINLEDTSSEEDSIVNSLQECVEGFEDMRLVKQTEQFLEQPHPTAVVPLLQNLSNIVSL